MSEAPDDPTFILASPTHLSPWVEQVWYSRGALAASRERVLPSATTDIVANLGPAMRLAQGEGTEQISGTTVTGLLTRPIVIEHPAVHEAVGVRLSAHGLRAVLGIPPAAVRDLVVDLHDVLDSSVDELVLACRAVAGSRARLTAAIDWLTHRIRQTSDGGDALTRWATAQIDLAHGSMPIADLHERSGYGATTFNQRFRDELGVTPKHYARLARFRAALERLDPRKSLCELAIELGFTDQSHMNREFRLLGDTSPTAVIEKRYTSGLTVAD